MTEAAALLDSAVVAHALGVDSPWKASCQKILRMAEEDTFRAYASVEMIQEVVYHRLRRTGDRLRSVQQARDAASLCTLLNFDREVLDLALDLIERVPTIRGRDAVHAASALAYGIDRIVSPDRAFDGLPGLTRIDPLKFAKN